jgi:fatty acid synthase subunit alpha
MVSPMISLLRSTGKFSSSQQDDADSRTALWALTCTMEALVMSGVTDPYELYKYVHPAEVGTSLGSGMGGMHSLQAMFKDRREEKDVQKDILQETYVNDRFRS